MKDFTLVNCILYYVGTYNISPLYHFSSRFYIVTYNVGTKSPNQYLADLLQWNNRSEKQLPDFCLFG